MEVIKDSIYDWPKYYEFIYGSDWKAETEFLEGCFERYAACLVRLVFEPACGTGRLLLRLAQRGYEVVGVDLNDKALAFCNRRLQKHGCDGRAFRADMSNFKLPRPCEAAFNTINSFRHLNSDEQAIAHFRCIAKSLRHGGIYVLGFHLNPSVGQPDEGESWSHRRGHLQVNASMWLCERDLSRRAEKFMLTFDVFTPTRQFRIEDQLEFRTYTLEQFQQLMTQIPQLQVVATYDFSYDIENPICVDEKTQDAVFILRRV